MGNKLKASLALLMMAPALASAHVDAGATTSFFHGFTHPIGGTDHILAMLAVGLWASQAKSPATWILPAAFIGAMCLGGLIAFSGLSMPLVEQGILLSILVLGVLIAGAFRLPVVYGSILVAVFAIFHGHAHGAEMPTSLSATTYALGFILATASLHLVGIGLGILLQKSKLELVKRVAGVAIALCGLILAVS